jgi:8-oxo-dGTP pyrophosphatase MutT (NUDIX family)
VTAPAPHGLDYVHHLGARLATLPADPLPSDRADAAVLILLRLGPEGPEVLAEQRATRTGDPWSGQVGLPGGRTEPTDQSLTETVLRELQEEVGLLPSALEGPPRLFDIRRARPSGLRVAAFVDGVANDSNGSARVDATEVDTTFWFPLEALAQTERRLRTTSLGEIYVDAVPFQGHVVWGFTLRLLQDFVAWLGAEVGTPPERPDGQSR